MPDAASAQDAARGEFEELVGPVALYPDDLLSIVLPAPTVPLQIVEADRWIKKNKGNADAVPRDRWDDAVKSLINYPTPYPVYFYPYYPYYPYPPGHHFAAGFFLGVATAYAFD